MHLVNTVGVVLIQGIIESPMEGTIYKTVATFYFYFCIYSFKICRHCMCVNISLCVYMCMCLHVSQIGHHLDCISFWGGASRGICTLSSQLVWLQKVLCLLNSGAASKQMWIFVSCLYSSTTSTLLTESSTQSVNFYFNKYSLLQRLPPDKWNYAEKYLLKILTLSMITLALIP